MPDSVPISNTAATLTDIAEQAAMLREALAYLSCEPTALADIRAAAQLYHVTQACTMLQSAAYSLRYAAERISALAPQISGEVAGEAAPVGEKS